MPVAPSAEQLAAIHACQEAVRRYCHGVDRLDGDWMKSAYWPDATDDHGTFVGNAMEFVDHCMTSHLRWRSTMHCVFNHTVELDPDGVHATGEAYNVTYLFRADADVIETWYGRYLDRYERRGDEWRISHRVCVNEGSTSEVIASPMAIAADKFRTGSFDRPSSGRSIGP
jgi:hypothetical protein